MTSTSLVKSESIVRIVTIREVREIFDLLRYCMHLVHPIKKMQAKMLNFLTIGYNDVCVPNRLHKHYRHATIWQPWRKCNGPTMLMYRGVWVQGR